jgi:site-specific recombinase XerD
MKDNLSTKFYLRYQDSGQNTKGLSKIYLRITVNRKKVELVLNSVVSPKDWSETLQQSTNNKILNEELLFIKNKIFEIKRNLVFQGKEVTAEKIRDLYLGKTNKEEFFLVKYYDDYIKKMENQPQDHSKIMIDKHKNSLNKVKQFLESQKKKDIRLEEINFKWISEYDYFLMTNLFNEKIKLSRNTANKQHNRLKAVLTQAFKEGRLPSDPYYGHKKKDTPTTREFLTQEEIDKLKKHDLGNNESLIRVRDMFLFSVYTGLRFSDSMALACTDIFKDKDGRYWINKLQEKTKERVMVPLLKYAVEIFLKYDNKEREITGFVLPRISNQKLNAYLKTIANLAKIDKVLTHHMSRHTFATTVTLSNEIPLEIVSKWLGHRSIKTTQIYAKITSQYLGKIADRLDEKL